MTPGFFSFTQNHLRLTDKICSMYSFTGALVALLMPLTLGQLFNKFPKIIFVMESVFLTASLSFFILVRLWISVSPRRDVKLSVKL